MSQKLVWNNIAAGWTHYRNRPIKEILEFAEKFDNKKQKIIDIGCGNCRNLLPFKKGELYGLDFSGEMIKEAKKLSKKQNIKINLCVSDAKNIPFKNHSFDIVLCTALLASIKENREKTINEMHRIMKPGGVAIITVWYKPGEKDKYIEWRSKDKSYKRFYHFFEKDELIGLLEKNGLNIIDFRISGKKEKNLAAIVSK